MHFTLDFQEKDVDDEETKWRKWHFFGEIRTFFCCFRELDSFVCNIHREMSERTEEKVLPRGQFGVPLGKNGVDYAPISWSEDALSREFWGFIFGAGFSFPFFYSDCVYCT